jgi:quercetin dioxygenase-like cupin family protein
MSSKAKIATIIDQGEGQPLNVMGHSATIMLTQQETNGDAYVFSVVSPPGAGIPPHVHEREDEYIYVAEGRYEIFLNGRTHEATAGAMLHFPRHIPHGFRNIGATPGKTVWTVTPGANFEPFFAELGALPADAPPDLQKVAAIFKKYGMEVLPPPGL